MNSYKYNEVVKCSVNIQVDSVDTDPTTLTFYVQDPRGTITKYVYGTDADLVKDSVGDYHVNVTGNKAGEWPYRYESTGTGAGSAEGKFKIEPSPFYPGG